MSSAELLESRLLLAGVTWSGGSGSWSDPTQWTWDDPALQGQIPDSDDDVEISSGVVNVLSNLSASSLDFQGGLIVSAADLQVHTALTWTGGDFGGDGTVTNASTSVMTVSGADPDRLINLDFHNHGTISWTTDSSIAIGDKLHNHGHIDWSGSGTMTGSGFLIGQTGSTLDITGNSEINVFVENYGTFTLTNQTLTLGSIGYFDNFGVLTLDRATITGPGTVYNNLSATVETDHVSASDTSTISTMMQNDGALDVQAGTLSLISGTHAGAAQVAGGALLKLSNYNIGSGAYSIGAGITEFAASVETVLGNSSVSNLKVTGDVIITNESTFTITESFDWESGDIIGSGWVVIGSDATATVSVASTLNLTLRNYGDILFSQADITLGSIGYIDNFGTLALDRATIGGAGTVYNNIGATLETAHSASETSTINALMQNDGTLDVQAGTLSLANGTHSGAAIVAGGSLLRLSNYNIGTGAYSVGAGITEFADTVETVLGNSSVSNLKVTGDVIVTNTSTFTVTDSFVWESGDITGSGSVVVEATAVSTVSTTSLLNLTFRNYGVTSLTQSHLTLGSIGYIDNLGVMSLDRSTISGSGTFYNNAAATLETDHALVTDNSIISALIQNDGGVDVQTGTLSLTKGAHSGTAQVASLATLRLGDVGNNFNIAGGTSITGAGDVVADGDVTVLGNASIHNLTIHRDQLVVTNLATLTVDGGLNWLGGTLSGTGSVTLGTGAQSVLDADGTLGLTLRNDGALAQYTSDLTLDVAGDLLNYGTWSFDSPSNGGSVSYLDSNASNTGGVENHGTINFSSALFTMDVDFTSWGTIEGSGTITGDLTNAGAVTVNGTLTVAGSYTQMSTGSLHLDVDSNPALSDQLVVTGTVDLAGQLNVSATGGIGTLPQRLIDNQSGTAVNGVFDSINLPSQTFLNYTGGTGDDIDIDPNNPPTLSVSMVTSSLAEDVDTAQRIKIADISVSDDSYGTNQLGLTGNDAALFEIDGFELFLKAGVALDHEAQSTLDVTITVDDTLVGLSPDDSQSISLSIGDVNEFDPTLTVTSFTLPENDAGTVTLAASDGDTSQTHTFSGTLPAGMSLDANTGVISIVAGTLDFESASSVTFDVTVTDSLASFRSTTSTVTIHVADLNEAPNLNDATFDLNENSANTTTVGTVTATDVDAGATLTYSIIAGNTEGAFTINDDGLITVANQAALNFEDNPTFALTVEVNDGTLTDTATVTINLNDVNEVPVLGDATFTLDENTANTTIVGTITATDVDANSTLTYSITAGNTGGAFTINNDGLITVANQDALDFEQNHPFTLTVEVSDGALTDTAAVTINLNDVNEAPVLNDATLTLDENSGNTTVVGTVTATDVDANTTLTYAIIAGNDLGGLTIDDNGQITVLDEDVLDFESNPVFTLTVQVSDGTLTDTATVTINLNDVNEAPVLDDASFTVHENSINGTLVGEVIATDVDANATLSYDIIAGNTSNAFAINDAGQITVHDETVLDLETIPTFTLTLQVSDGTLMDTATVTIHLTNVNEPPVLDDATLSLPENSSNTILVGTVTATDTDANTTVSYAITDGNVNDAFAINDDGEITVNNAAALDYEVNPTFLLIVQVTDDGNPQLSDTATITIQLTNVNEAPVVNDAIWSLAENTAIDSTVGTVTATDVDANTTLTYSITTGNTEGAFTIDNNGLITVIDPSVLDFETNPTFTFTVEASDGTLTDTATITINLSDINEAPVLDDVNFSLDENSEDGTEVGTVAATDVDAGTTLTYDIVAGNDLGGFAINDNGLITVVDENALDFESNPTFVLTVQVSDGTLVDTATITINLNDVNDPPVLDDVTFSLDENSPNNNVVGTVTATDVDANTIQTYAIIAGNDLGGFTIDDNGLITVLDQDVLDFESNATFTLTVRVSDGTLTDTATVTINLNDVNDAPVLDDATFALDENTANSTSVGILTATDVDANSTLTYSITAGNTDGAFTIDNNGLITVANQDALDFEDNPTFALTVEVNDGTLTDTATVTINLNDVNDPPVINDAIFSLAENSTQGALVGVVLGTDTEATTLVHSIIGGNTNSAFTIDPLTGEITVYNSNAIDFESNPSFTLSIRALEVEFPNLYDTATVTINVSDVTTVAVDDSFEVNHASTLFASLYANDIDPVGMSVALVDPLNAPTGLTLYNNGNIRFQPPTGSLDDVTLQYQITDNLGQVTTANVFIDVTNTTPTPQPDLFDVPSGQNFTASVLDNDTDPDGNPLTVMPVNPPTNGFATLDANGTLTYIPNNRFSGTDTLTYYVTDGVSISGLVTVTFAVTIDNPIVEDDEITTHHSRPITFDVVYNDYDPEGDRLYVASFTNPSHGQIVNNNDGTLTYIPNGDFEGTDTFNYVATDGENSSLSSATVTVDVTNSFALESGAISDVATLRNTRTRIFGHLQLRDLDGDNLVYSIEESPEHGTALVQGAAESYVIEYQPETDYVGEDSFFIQVSDGIDELTMKIEVSVYDFDDPAFVGVTPEDTIEVTEDVPFSGVVGHVNIASHQSFDDITVELQNQNLSDATISLDSEGNIVLSNAVFQDVGDRGGTYSIHSDELSTTYNKTTNFYVHPKTFTVEPVTDPLVLNGTYPETLTESDVLLGTVSIDNPDELGDGLIVEFNNYQGVPRLQWNGTGYDILGSFEVSSEGIRNIEVAITRSNVAMYKRESFTFVIDATFSNRTVSLASTWDYVNYGYNNFVPINHGIPYPTESIDGYSNFEFPGGRVGIVEYGLPDDAYAEVVWADGHVSSATISGNDIIAPAYTMVLSSGSQQAGNWGVREIHTVVKIYNHLGEAYHHPVFHSFHNPGPYGEGQAISVSGPGVHERTFFLFNFDSAEGVVERTSHVVVNDVAELNLTLTTELPHASVVRIDWGEGTGQFEYVTASSLGFTAQHQYTTAGTYQAKMDLLMADGSPWGSSHILEMWPSFTVHDLYTAPDAPEPNRGPSPPPVEEDTSDATVTGVTETITLNIGDTLQSIHVADIVGEGADVLESSRSVDAEGRVEAKKPNGSPFFRATTPGRFAVRTSIRINGVAHVFERTVVVLDDYPEFDVEVENPHVPALTEQSDVLLATITHDFPVRLDGDHYIAVEFGFANAIDNVRIVEVGTGVYEVRADLAAFAYGTKDFSGTYYIHGESIRFGGTILIDEISEVPELVLVDDPEIIGTIDYADLDPEDVSIFADSGLGNTFTIDESGTLRRTYASIFQGWHKGLILTISAPGYTKTQLTYVIQPVENPNWIHYLQDANIVFPPNLSEPQPTHLDQTILHTPTISPSGGEFLIAEVPLSGWDPSDVEAMNVNLEPILPSRVEYDGESALVYARLPETFIGMDSATIDVLVNLSLAGDGFAGDTTINVNAAPYWMMTASDSVDTGRGDLQSISGQESISLWSGELQLAHNIGDGLSFIYNSAETSVRPVVTATISRLPHEPWPDSVELNLIWNDRTPITRTFDLTGLDASAEQTSVDLGIQLNDPIHESGVYDWTLVAKVSGDGHVRELEVSDFTAVVVNDSTDESEISDDDEADVETFDSFAHFGAGWSVGGTMRLLDLFPYPYKHYVYKILIANSHPDTLFSHSQNTSVGAEQRGEIDHITWNSQTEMLEYQKAPNMPIYRFGELGFLREFEDARGNTTRYEYDEEYRLSQVVQPGIGTTTFVYETESPFLDRVVLSDGRIVDVTIANGELQSIKHEDSVFAQATRHFEYTDRNLIRTYWSDASGTASEVNYEYSPSTGRLNKVIVGSSTSSTIYNITAATDTTVKTVVSLSENGYGILTSPTNDQGTATTSVPNIVQKFRFDSWGRSTTIIRPDEVDGEKVVETIERDQFGNVSYTTDAKGRQTRFFRNDDGSTTHEFHFVEQRYTYDAHTGFLYEHFDPFGTRSRFSHNYDGQLEWTEQTDGQHWSNWQQYYYNDQGLVSYYETYDYRKQAYDLGISYVYNDRNLLFIEMMSNRLGDPNVDRTRMFLYDSFGFVDTITDHLGNVTDFDYDARGLLRQKTITDVNFGLVFSEQYDYYADGALKSVTDGRGVITEYVYDLAGQVTDVYEAKGTPEQRHTVTEYYDDGSIKKVTNQTTGDYTEYHYDPVNRKQWVTQSGVAGAAGGLHTIETTRDVHGNVIETKDELTGAVVKYEYDHMDRLSKMTQVGVILETGGTPQDLVTTYNYDANGNLLQEKGPDGVRTHYVYNAFNQLERSSVVDPNGGAFDYEFDHNGNLLKQTEYRFTPDSNGGSYAVWTTEHVYNGFGELVQTTDAENGITEYAYDPLGNPLSTIDRNGTATTYVYDVLGQLRSVTDAAGGVTDYQYDLAGNVTQQTITSEAGSANPVSRVTKFQYDGLNRVTHQHVGYDANNPSAGLLTRTFYDHPMGDGFVADVASSRPHVPGTSILASQLSYVVYDSVGKVIRSADVAPTSGDSRLYVDYAYAFDATTQTYVITQTTPDTNTTSRSTTATYNSFGMQLQATDSTGAVIAVMKYDSAGRLFSQSNSADGNNGYTTYQYDPATGQVRHILVSDGTGNVPDRTEYYLFDSAGNRVKAFDPEGNITRWTYDGLGRVVEESTTVKLTHNGPLTNVSRAWIYNGLTTTYFDRNGRQINYISNPATRTMTESWGGTGEEIVTSYNAAGEIVQVTDPNSTRTITYDNLGRAATQNQQASFAGFSLPQVTFGYQWHDIGVQEHVETSLNGQLISRVSNRIDQLGRTTGLHQDFAANQNAADLWSNGSNASDKAVSFAYHLDGRRTNITRFDRHGLSGPDPYATGLDNIRGITNYDYDTSDTSKIDLLEHYLDSQSSRIANYSFTYSGNGPATGYQAIHFDLSLNWDRKEVRSYQFDFEQRYKQLTNEVYYNNSQTPGTTSTELFTYDQNGNRVSYDSGTNVPYTVHHNRLLAQEIGLGQQTQQTFDYDAEGNVLQISHPSSTHTLTWDHRNRLTQLTTINNGSTTTVSYFYDAFDQLIGRKEVVDGTTTSMDAYILEGGRRTFELDLTNSGKITQAYFNGPKANEILAIDVALPSGTGTGTTETVWLFADPAGNARTLLKYDRTVGAGGDPWSYLHRHVTEFGVPQLGTSGDLSDPALSAVPEYFGGMIADGEELYVAQSGGNIYYSRSGRFLSSEAGGYGYQQNNPMNPNALRREAYASPKWESLEGPSAFSNTFNQYAGSFLYNNGNAAGHFALDVAGLVPLFGNVADAVNAVWYLAEGRNEEAVLSGVAAIPLFGYVATAAQLGKYGSKAARVSKYLTGGARVTQVLRATRRIDAAINFGQAGYFGYQGYQSGSPLQIGFSALGLGVNGRALYRSGLIGDTWRYATSWEFDPTFARRAVTQPFSLGPDMIPFRRSPGFRSGGSNAPRIVGRTSIISKLDDVLADQLAAIKKIDPDARIGIRGSLASGVKGPHKGNVPFDSLSFDIDIFIISDKLRRGRGFQVGPKPLRDLAKQIDAKLRQLPEFAGLRGGKDKLQFRIFSLEEIRRKAQSGDIQIFFGE